MNFDQIYQDQVMLLLEVLPVLNEFPAFALKGGTAINLFIRDMPRLSVDIDLTYLPLEDRTTFLNNMQNTMLKMKNYIEKQGLVVKEGFDNHWNEKVL
jgi:uncharacterized membrane-anchored protein